MSTGQPKNEVWMWVEDVALGRKELAEAVRDAESQFGPSDVNQFYSLLEDRIMAMRRRQAGDKSGGDERIQLLLKTCLIEQSELGD